MLDFAAAQFVRETETRLDGRIVTSLSAARHAIEGHTGMRSSGGAGPLPRRPQDDCNCPPAASTLTTFAVSSSRPVYLDGAALDDTLVPELAAAVDAADDHRRAQLRFMPDTVVISAPGHYRGEAVLLGVVARESFVTDVFDRVAMEAALLPGTLIDPNEARKLAWPPRVR